MSPTKLLGPVLTTVTLVLAVGPAQAADISGTVTQSKEVKVKGENRSNLVVLVTPEQGQAVAVDLGPAKALKNRDLKNKQIQASGPIVRIGDRPVLMAESLKADGSNVKISRAGDENQRIAQATQQSDQQAGAPDQQALQRQVQGKVVQTKEVAVPGQQDKNIVAQIRTNQGETIVVDLGPASKAPAADQLRNQNLSLSGFIARVGDRMVVLADRYTAGQQTVQVNRPQQQRTASAGDAAGMAVLQVQSEVIGKSITNQQGETLGQVDDLIVDRSGAVQYLVVSPAQDLKAGDRKMLVPWHAITSLDQDSIMLPMSKDRFAKAPGLSQQQMGQTAQRDWNAVAFEYYGLVLVPEQSEFSQLDTDSNNQISNSEAQANRSISARFNHLDKDNSGSLSQSEFSAWEAGSQSGSQQGGANAPSP